MRMCEWVSERVRACVSACVSERVNVCEMMKERVCVCVRVR